jgi:SP family sugar:H+ symporter-like MFS transporter
MRFYRKTTEDVHEKGTPANSTPTATPPRSTSPDDEDVSPKGRVPAIAVILGAVASIGGFMFGYESGQISGFLAMPDFIERFGDNGEFSPVRQGTIVGLLA